MIDIYNTSEVQSEIPKVWRNNSVKEDVAWTQMSLLLAVLLVLMLWKVKKHKFVGKQLVPNFMFRRGWLVPTLVSSHTVAQCRCHPSKSILIARTRRVYQLWLVHGIARTFERVYTPLGNSLGLGV